MTELPPELAVDDEPFTDAELDEDVFRHVYDDEQAEWAMRKLVALTTELDALTTQYGRYVARIDRWYEDVTGPLVTRATRLRSMLERYGLMTRERHKRNTVRLPSGDVRTRRPSQPSVVIADEDALRPWFGGLDPVTRAQVTRTTVTPLISEIRKVVRIKDDKVVDLNGEVVAGLRVQEPETTATVEPAIRSSP